MELNDMGLFQKRCWACSGTGLQRFPPPSNASERCRACNGTGFLPFPKEKRIRGQCRDCKFEFEGPESEVRGKGVEHELKHRGHWVDTKKQSAILEGRHDLRCH